MTVEVRMEQNPMDVSIAAAGMPIMSGMPADATALLHIEVPVIVQIGERDMLLREVLDLRPGSIIELPKETEEPLELLVNNKVIGSGQAVKVGENFGIQINAIGTPSDTLRAMAGRDEAPPSPATGDDAPSPEMTPFAPQPIGDGSAVVAADANETHAESSANTSSTEAA